MGEMVTLERKATTIRDMMAKNQKLIESALPRHMSPDRFLRIALTSMSKNPKLLECTPRSLFGAVLQCAQLGLEPDDLRGSAYLIPFKNHGTYEVQVMPGYKGLLELAHRSGKIADIKAEVVHEADAFDFEYGSRAFLFHKPNLKDDPGELVAVYAMVIYKSGTMRFEVMSPREVMKAASSSNAYQSNSGPWHTHPGEMWKKTALRRLCKTIPLSAEVETAVALDERESAGITQDLSALIPDLRTDEAEKKSGLDGLTDKLKEEKPRPEPEQQEASTEQAEQHRLNAGGIPAESGENKEETDDQKADKLIAQIRQTDLETLESTNDSLQEMIKGFKKVKQRIAIINALNEHKEILGDANKQ